MTAGGGGWFLRRITGRQSTGEAPEYRALDYQRGALDYQRGRLYADAIKRRDGSAGRSQALAA